MLVSQRLSSSWIIKLMQVQKNLPRLLAAACWLACWATTSHAGPLLLVETTSSTAQGTVGDVVDKLGDNLMLVHQDSRNHWWFATWGDGLYRFDGKVMFTTRPNMALVIIASTRFWKTLSETSISARHRESAVLMAISSKHWLNQNSRNGN